MPREDVTREARKHRLQYSRDAAERLLNTVREEMQNFQLPVTPSLTRQVVMGRLRSAIVISFYDPTWARQLVAEGYVLLEKWDEI